MRDQTPIEPARRSRTRAPVASHGTDRPRVSGAQVCKWIEDFCRVPEGRLLPRPVELAPFQRRFICDVYDNPYGTRHAFLSFGRKNGKTAIAAFLLLNHLCGKSFRQNSQLFSTAQSREQAAVIFQLAAKIVRLSPDLQKVVTIRDTAKELLCPEKGTRYRALSAEASTAYGLSPVFVVHDELGQVRGPRSELYEALETATGAQEDPLSVVISTQAPTDSDLLSILIDDAKAGHDRRTIISIHTAPMDEDPFARATIAKAGRFAPYREHCGLRRGRDTTRQWRTQPPAASRKGPRPLGSRMSGMTETLARTSRRAARSPRLADSCRKRPGGADSRGDFLVVRPPTASGRPAPDPAPALVVRRW
jgi:hypothetical protein